jgi:hypothetical protein
MWISWRVPGSFQLNRHKSFKNRAEFVKDDVINHVVARTSSEWYVIENAWQNTDIARKADSRMAMNCQSYCYGILHFVLGSHLILQRIMSCLSLCCSEINRLFSILFWQNILIKLQHAIKVNQSWRLKVFWLQKWLDACWKNERWPNKFWAHT